MHAVRDRSRRTPATSSGSGVDRAFAAQLIRVMYERDAKCPDCRYSLDGLVGHRCPECGRSVEEFLRMVDTMPRRWAMLRRKMLDRRVRQVLAVVLTLGAVCIAGWLIANFA